MYSRLLILLLLMSTIVEAQTDKGAIYRRSSLYTFMITDPVRDYAEEIQNTFINSPIPDKFNDHNLEIRKIKSGLPPNEKFTREEIFEKQQKQIRNFIDENDLAKEMVAKWFNRKPNGAFDMDLIAHRGSYNASEMDVELAKSSKRGNALLADAGEELIKNTFVVVNDFEYINKEDLAETAKEGLGFLSDVVNTDVLGKAVKTFGKGYVIRTTSYLYQLEWNDSVAAVFYNDYWISGESIDAARKEAFENSDIFKLKLIGREVAWADLQSTIYTKKSPEKLISIATIRALDAVIAKLQRKYEVFRTKTPLYSGDPLAAKIGLKEGLEKGDKYEVLEQIMDKEGRTRYKRKGVIKVVKNQIWDNRHMAGEDPDNKADDLQYTVFKGGKNFYKGMLIRQIN